jgi:hypothetical protein
MSNTGGADSSEGASRLVRAYAVTGGRTHSHRDDLELETLISTSAHGEAAAPSLGFERRSIAALCREVLSIAEVSACLDLPLGVVRILVSDMANEQLVILHRPASSGERPSLALLERVLDGLRTL